MAQFRAVVQGRSESDHSCIGDKHSGVHATIQSYEGRINVRMWHDPCYGCDFVRVTFGPHSSDSEPVVVLFEGPCSSWRQPLSMRAVRACNDEVKHRHAARADERGHRKGDE